MELTFNDIPKEFDNEVSRDAKFYVYTERNEDVDVDDDDDDDNVKSRGLIVVFEDETFRTLEVKKNGDNKLVFSYKKCLPNQDKCKLEEIKMKSIQISPGNLWEFVDRCKQNHLRQSENQPGKELCENSNSDRGATDLSVFSNPNEISPGDLSGFVDTCKKNHVKQTGKQPGKNLSKNSNSPIDLSIFSKIFDLTGINLSPYIKSSEILVVAVAKFLGVEALVRTPLTVTPLDMISTSLGVSLFLIQFSSRSSSPSLASTLLSRSFPKRGIKSQ